jgi:hypothetical protein
VKHLRWGQILVVEVVPQGILSVWKVIWIELFLRVLRVKQFVFFIADSFFIFYKGG